VATPFQYGLVVTHRAPALVQETEETTAPGCRPKDVTQSQHDNTTLSPVWQGELPDVDDVRTYGPIERALVRSVYLFWRSAQNGSLLNQAVPPRARN
jgi:hypothetical protein